MDDHRPFYSQIANPYSENEESDNEDKDYTVFMHSADEGSEGPEGDDTLVPEQSNRSIKQVTPLLKG